MNSVRTAALLITPIVAFTCFAQLPTSVPDAPATVYIYRLRQFQGSKRRMTLSLDGARFAYLQNGRYWKIKLSPGVHILSDKNADDNIKFTVVSGSASYIRGEWAENGLLGFNARFSVVDEETAVGDVRRLKPGDGKEIQNHGIDLAQ